jgi:hypothetical protein
LAGETPGAATSRRKRLNWNDDKSTNKVYASGDISALGTQTASDTVKKPEGQAGVATPVVRADDKSADKYYANGGSQRVRGPQVAKTQKLGPPAKLGVNAPKQAPRSLSGKLFINDQTEINGVLQQLIEQLKGGAVGVVLSVKKGDSPLLRRTRAALEMLVTREVITEEQYHEVRLSYEQEAVLPLPEQQPEVKVEDATNAVDPMDFLNADSSDNDEVINTSPAAETTEVDTTDDVVNNSAAATDDDDDSDYGRTTVNEQAEVAVEANTQPEEPAAEPQTSETQPEQPTESDEDSKPRRGRRSGRGSS